MSESGRPPLSVVVPTHDTRELTLACLAALARQDLPGIEVILVDDASSDGTAEAVAAWHVSVRVIRNDRPAGFTRSANLGLRSAKGEVSLLLNSDTEVDPGGLAALLAAFAADPRLGAAGGALRYPDGRPQWSGGAAPSLLWLFGLASGLPALLGRLPLYRRLRPPAGTGPGRLDWVTGAALGLRRTALASLATPATPADPGLPGPLDEGFRFYGQDLDLCLRLAAAGWRVAVVPGFGVMHHHGADHRPAGRSEPWRAPEPRAPVDGPPLLGGEAPRRTLGGAGSAGDADRRGAAARRPEPPPTVSAASRPGGVRGRERGIAAGPTGDSPASPCEPAAARVERPLRREAPPPCAISTATATSSSCS